MPPVRIFSVLHHLAVDTESSKGSVTEVDDTIKQIRQAIGRMCDPRTPKVFLCHSLGCNLVKEIILEQQEMDGDGWVKNVKGVVFYGGPHLVSLH